jgi:hypothetical protein
MAKYTTFKNGITNKRKSGDQEMFAVNAGEVTGDFDHEFTNLADARKYAESLLSREEPTAHIFIRTGRGFVDMVDVIFIN